MQEAREAAQALVSSGRPESVADVILLAEVFGDERAREVVEEEMRAVAGWRVEPWAAVVAYLQALDDRSKRDLFVRVVEMLRSAPVNMVKLLATRNVAVELLSLANGLGSPEHREWLLRMLQEVLSPAGTSETLKRQHLVPQYLKLVSRCVMQPRNG